MDEKNGGPAFPRITHIEAPQTIGHMAPQFSRVRSSEGMSLRDWFAGQALGAIIQADGIQYANKVEGHALVAYRQADAMLAAREIDLREAEGEQP